MAQIFCPGLSEQTNFLRKLGQVSFKLELLDIFCNFKAFLPSQQKYKASQFRNSFKLNNFALALFCNFGLGQKLTEENFQLWSLVSFWKN